MSGVVKFVLYWTGYYILVPKTEWVDWEIQQNEYHCMHTPVEKFRIL